MKFSRTPIFLLLFLMVLTSCVSKKKYGEMETLKNRLQGLVETKDSDISKLKSDIATLTSQKNECDEARAKLAADTTRLAATNRKMRNDMAEMKASCDQINNNYQQLKAKSSEKMKGLLEELEALQSNLAQREKRLAEVERMLNQRDSVMTMLKKRVTDALLGFKDDGLTVDVRDGKVYVSLSNKLLFASGSTKIDANGQKALVGLAGVLKEQKDLTIMVEGNTDDVPVSNLGAIKDNWDLSVMRSTEVVRILVANGVEPTRIVPAGHGEFVPKVMGTSAEARAANRRTEIVLSPKLDELFQLINQQR